MRILLTAAAVGDTPATWGVDRTGAGAVHDKHGSFSVSPELSPDGRFLGFNSGASNLVEGDHRVRVGPATAELTVRPR